MSDDCERRALCLGVSPGDPTGVDPLDEPELAAFDALPFAGHATVELAEELEVRGVAVTCVVDPAELSSDELGERVKDFLHSFPVGSQDVAFVHVLGHGTVGQSGELSVVGSDARTHPMTQVGWWRSSVTDHGPLTLFLIDLCHAGASMRGWRPPRPERDETEQAWVIAATGSDDPAYAGRFTRAVTEALRGLVPATTTSTSRCPGSGSPSSSAGSNRPCSTCAQAEQGIPQHVVCTPTMGEPPELRFVPNPRYQTPPPTVAAAAEVEPATAEFVDPLRDPVMDARHFEARASGHGRAADLAGGAFRGRAPQLSQLTRWLGAPSRRGEREQTPLMLVRGSPGSGKSALLGVCVCAAHPQLRSATAALWQVAAHRPSLQHNLAAVHARQHDLTEITASLGRQLLGGDGGVHPSANLYPGPDISPSGPRSPEDLVAALRVLPEPPTIVLDALDEALDPEALIDRLLLPLARATRDGGIPACRLLVGTRPWAAFGRLLDYAERHGEVLDLDAIPVAQRRADLVSYVAALLELNPDLADAATAASRNAFAHAVADTLTAGPPERDSRGPTRAPSSAISRARTRSPRGPIAGERPWWPRCSPTKPAGTINRRSTARRRLAAWAPRCRLRFRRSSNSTWPSGPGRRGDAPCWSRWPTRAARASPSTCSPQSPARCPESSTIALSGPAESVCAWTPRRSPTSWATALLLAQ